ncbi:hypothetical protein BKA70DRAFT_1262162 [Coprinopsis sp. MPI-PUGE-AT-0042]|nr:hypothetical protein BKA70DRAFT_1262162 [Coprinopsis sp. MPI-PUGE-AT-0042]
MSDSFFVVDHCSASGPGKRFRCISQGTNVQGNHYCNHVGTQGQQGYYYYNQNGSQYWKNIDGSTYFVAVDGAYQIVLPSEEAGDGHS